MIKYLGAPLEDYDDEVVYVAYGSNKKQDRFMKYIEGGDLEYTDPNGVRRVKHYKGCQLNEISGEQYRCTIPYKTYFANKSSIWGGKGVAFLDPRESKSGDKTDCRVYVVDISQLFDICEQEGIGDGWYNFIIEIGTINGFRAFTITNEAKEEDREDLRAPSEEYIKTIAEGDKECETLDEAVFDGTIDCTTEEDDERGISSTILKEYR